MATIPCKQCGGMVELSDGITLGECPYCGSVTTFPKLDSDKREQLYNRAEQFRSSGNFDRAIGVYEEILRETPEDAEAYWGLVISRFGIEYVVDPQSHERIPTCHRVQYESILSDGDYHAALEHADGAERHVYESEAKRIAEIQKNILRISAQEKPFDVFICYKETTDGGSRTKDSVVAQDIYYQLTNAGYKVFFSRITLESKLGQQYEPYIFAALNSAKVMLVVGSKKEYFNAVWVRNEWSRYLALMKTDRSRLLIPCYRDMDPYDIPDELSMLQSQDMSKIGFIQDLLRGIQKVMDNAPKSKPAVAVKPLSVPPSEKTANMETDVPTKRLLGYICTKCKQRYESEIKFCTECGGRVIKEKQKQYVCGGCGKVFLSPIRFCSECGQPVYEESELKAKRLEAERLEAERLEAVRLTRVRKFKLSDGNDIELMKISAGTFMMGSHEAEMGRHKDEKQHPVTLTRDFWIGIFPVTQRQYAAIKKQNPSYFDGANRPVEQVSWNNAKDFCKRMNQLFAGQLPTGYQFDLPTEAQWEYACRAGTTTSLNSGQDLTSKYGNCCNLNKIGWYSKSAVDETHPVGEKCSNNWELFDMHGNVWEWCRDIYKYDYQNDPEFLSEQTSQDVSWHHLRYVFSANPCDYRVVRGGSWANDARVCRAASRDRKEWTTLVNFIGFRLALVPVQ